MRKTRNITVAVSVEAYRKARRWAAEHDASLSGAVSVFIEHLELFDSVVRRNREKNLIAMKRAQNTKIDF